MEPLHRSVDFGAAGTIGNASRNVLPGPPLVPVNLTLSQTLSVGAETRLQFRSELLNAFNQTNRAFPSRNINTPGAGLIRDTSTMLLLSAEVQHGFFRCIDGNS